VAPPVRSVSTSGRHGVGFRWRWPIALAAPAAGAVAVAVWGPGGPDVVVYPTSDFARLPVSAASLTPAAPTSCASLRPVNGAMQLVDEACGSPASTFRVIGRVAEESQCVHDADLTYAWSSGAKSGVACLDYDWAADQCLQITKESVAKVNCADRGAVRPQMAIIGAVDVSYCSGGGIAHRVRHFTVCTLAGDKNCKDKKRGT
jgi:hypothetical protein